MIGCTLVLKRKRKKYRKSNFCNFKKSKKFSLPVLLIIVAVLISILYPKNEKKIEYSTVKNITNEVIAQADDYSKYYFALVSDELFNYNEKTGIENQDKIFIGIWSFLNNEKNKNKYEYFNGKISVPSEKIEQEFYNLFNKKIDKNQSIKSDNFSFEYDKNNDSYIVPITNLSPKYSGQLLKTTKENNNIILYVGCLDNKNYSQNKDGNTVEPEPSFIIKITLKNKSDKYYIYSSEKVKAVT